MTNWLAYVRECFNTELWGFVCLDYYYRSEKREGPARFIDQILQEAETASVNAVSFHNVLVSLCVQLLGSDFDAIIEKSLSFLKSRWTTLTVDEIRQIAAHYAVYGKREAIM